MKFCNVCITTLPYYRRIMILYGILYSHCHRKYVYADKIHIILEYYIVVVNVGRIKYPDKGHTPGYPTCIIKIGITGLPDGILGSSKDTPFYPIACLYIQV